MAKTISVNDEIILTSKLSKAHRKGIARICQIKTLTSIEKLQQVKRYLQHVKDVVAINITDRDLNIFTSGPLNSHYTYSI